jgi:predicted GTPase
MSQSERPIWRRLAYLKRFLTRATSCFAREWLFEKGVVAPSGLPTDGRIEIAFAGRSNVGKSSCSTRW